ncbi:MAG: 16S rRNA (adenine(1518)-N(6)/adenine(1519)-N(6))-dimethyltransferase RsmA [Tissierellia bacterium]|nr:16S rRNA (adenine(1518)-N(6)/adenine(1519)-N(6))-dimethyltransferase RsmA [Tissierellia bacterium]
MLYQPSVIKDILTRHGFQTKKQLGQNFLIDGNIIRNIMDKANIGPEDNIIEIGPGIGTLTEALASRASQVIAIEKDDDLLPVLEETLPQDNIKVIHGDILKIDLAPIVEELSAKGPVKVVSNLPYYITTPIIAMLLESKLPIKSITVMVQQEVGERMVAGPGSKTFGALSLLCSYYSKPALIQKAPAGVFMPRPKVDSVVVNLEIIESRNFEYEDKMFKLIHAAFMKRRKTLSNALSIVEKDVLEKALKKADIDSNLRPEALGIDKWMSLTEAIEGERL